MPPFTDRALASPDTYTPPLARAHFSSHGAPRTQRLHLFTRDQARRERIARRVAALESGEVIDTEPDPDYIDPTPIKSNAKIAEVAEVRADQPLTAPRRADNYILTAAGHHILIALWRAGRHLTDMHRVGHTLTALFRLTLEQ
jgi:hypothetical protein